MHTGNQIAGFFKVLYLQKEVRDQVDFLHVDKYQSFLQDDNIDIGGRGQLKQQVCNIIVSTPLSAGGGGVEPPTQFSTRGREA